MLPQNCAGVLHEGRVEARYAKHHLPNYGVFDEYRYLRARHRPDRRPGRRHRRRRRHLRGPLAGGRPGRPHPRGRRRAAAGHQRLAVRARTRTTPGWSCAPAARREAGCAAGLPQPGRRPGRAGLRRRLAGRRRGRHGARPRDRSSARTCWWSTSTSPRAPSTRPARPRASCTSPSSDQPDRAVRRGAGAARAAAGRRRRGLRGADRSACGDYVRKNGFRSVLLGLSGGIDSTLVATIAADAIGGENVVGVSIPSRYSSQHSRDDAAELAERTRPGLPRHPDRADGQRLPGQRRSCPGVAEENLQARVRALVWMGLSNQEGHLVLANSNKSELSVGYSTHLRRQRRRLRPDQGRAQDAGVGARPVAQRRGGAARRDAADPGEHHHQAAVGRAAPGPGRPGLAARRTTCSTRSSTRTSSGAQGRAELVAAGFDQAVVDKVVGLVDRAEWKRRQFAPGPKISRLAFGRDRRLPVTSRWREQDS